jgi:large subunit ribosomal protein L10
LLARLLATMQGPMSGLVNVLQGVQRKFLYVLQAIQTAKENQS